MRNEHALPIRKLMHTLRKLNLIDNWEVGADLYKYWLKKKREQETDPINLQPNGGLYGRRKQENQS